MDENKNIWKNRHSRRHLWRLSEIEKEEDKEGDI